MISLDDWGKQLRSFDICECGKRKKKDNALCTRCNYKLSVKPRPMPVPKDEGYCQNNHCPKRLQLLSRKQMIKYGELWICSEKCKQNLIDKWNEIREWGRGGVK